MFNQPCSGPPEPRVLLLGGRGFMGQRFLTLYPKAAAPEVDIACPAAVRRALEEHAPHVVINCAGKTGRPNVDWCEEHRAETLRGNVTGPPGPPGGVPAAGCLPGAPGLRLRLRR